MGGLYRLVVGVSLKDQTKTGFSQLERQSAEAQKKVDALRKSLSEMQKTSGNFEASRTAHRALVGYAREEINLRKQLVNVTDKEEKDRIESELKAIGLMKQELSVRKQELTMREKLNRDYAKDQEQIEKEDASRRMRLDREVAAEAYRQQREQKKRDLASIKMIEQARKDAILAGQRAEANRMKARADLWAETRSNFGMVGGLAAGSASSFLLGGLKQGAQSGGDIQTALTTTQIATGADQKTMDAIRDKAFDIANYTAQSAADAMNNIAKLAGSGITDPKQLLGIAKPIAQFADIQFYKNHTSFEDSATQGLQIAHLFGAFTEKKITPLLEQLTKVSFAMPDNLNKFLTQGGQYMTVFNAAGVNQNDTLEAGAIMDRIGMGKGRGGASLGNILLNQMNALAVSGHVQKGRIKGLKALGLANSDGTSPFYKWDQDRDTHQWGNHFHIIDALKQIDKSVRKVPEGLTGKAATAWQLKRLGAVNAALGLTGERAALAITPEAIAGIEDSFRRVGMSHGMSNIQDKYMNTLPAQEARFKSNMDSLWTDVMWPWQNQLRKGFMWMGDEAHTMQSWLHANRDGAKGISAVLGALGIGLGVLSAKQFLGLGGTLKGIAAGLQLLGASSVTAAGEIGAAEATVQGGVAFGLGGEVLGGAAFATARNRGLIASTLGLGGRLVAPVPLGLLGATLSTSGDQGSNASNQGALSSDLRTLGYTKGDLSANSDGGMIYVSGDIHINVPAGTEKQQLTAIIRGIKNGAASAKRQPVSKANFSSW